MAYFAQLDENDNVIQVLKIGNNELTVTRNTLDEDGALVVVTTESEAKGVEFLRSIFGQETNWVQTSYNDNFRGKYAGVGDWYDRENNKFMDTRPVLNEPMPEVPQTPIEEADPEMPLGNAAVNVAEVLVVDSLNSSEIGTLVTANIPSLEIAEIVPLSPEQVNNPE